MEVTATSPPGKKLGVRSIESWMSPSAGLEVWRREKSLVPTGIRTAVMKFGWGKKKLIVISVVM